MTKLSWSYDNSLGCEVAMHNGYRIRAEHDSDADNPFEAWDGNWPIAVYNDRSITIHDKIKAGAGPTDPLDRFKDDQLVHNQKAIAVALNTTIPEISNEYCDLGDDEEPANYIHDADALRDAFERELGNVDDCDKLSVCSALHDILGIPSYVTTSRGHSQGDWAEILVVATPEACAEFGLEKPLLGLGPDAHIAAYWDDKLESTADLWGAWAWGDVYGYIIEAPVYAEDGEIEEWEEIEYGSCWGFYGDDFDESGLAEAALECVPDEPAPGPPEPVGSSNNLVECV